jgi:hypothetical protein
VRTAARIVIGIAVLIVAGLVAVRLFLGSERGRRAAERQIDRRVVARLGGGHVHVDHLAGTLVGGLTIDGLEWRDAAGRVALRARRVVARWSAPRALVGRPRIDVRVESPDVDLDILAAGIDLNEAARLLSDAGKVASEVTIGRLEVTDGTVRAAGRTFAGVELAGQADVGKTRRLGDRGELRLDRGRARVELGGMAVAAAGAGAIRWDAAAGRLELERLALVLGSSRLAMSGSIDAAGVDVRLEDLRIDPRDLRRLSPRAEVPRTALVGQGRAQGPRDRVALSGWLRPDRGRILLSGVLDTTRRRGEVRVRVLDAETDFMPAVVSGTVTLTGAVTGAELAIDWRADGSYVRRADDPNLPPGTPPARRRDFAATISGGRFQGGGELRVRAERGAPAARLDFRLAIDDPGQAARLVAGRDEPASAATPSAEPLVLRGQWTLGPQRPASLTVERVRGVGAPQRGRDLSSPP